MLCVYALAISIRCCSKLNSGSIRVSGFIGLPDIDIDTKLKVDYYHSIVV